MLRSLTLAVAAAASLTSLAACGDGSSVRTMASAEVLDQGLTRQQADPAPAAAPGTLSRIAAAGGAQTRIGYVNRRRLAGLDAPLPAGEVAWLVLGAGAARLAAAVPAFHTATQIGQATVLDGATRTIVGGSPALRRTLSQVRPLVSLVTPETESAVQSCLGDAITETIVGPRVLGEKAALGVGLQDGADAPAGPKLLLCFAPHFRRDLAATERRLRAAFGAAGLPQARRPVIEETDIGERDITRAVVSLRTVPAARLRELLAGGPALLALAGHR